MLCWLSYAVAASLAENVKVEAEGTIDAAGTLVAERIIIKLTDSIRVEGTVSAVDLTARTVSTDVGLTFVIRTLTELEDRGPVTAEDEVAGTVDILAVTVTGMVGVTEYRDGAVINQAGFHALVERGTFVEARWDAFTSTAVTADQLSLEEDDD